MSNAIRAASECLSETSDTARLDAELLMTHALGMSRSEMLLRHMDQPAPQGFAALIARRAAHEPVAHITGMQEFYGREFAVTPETLIPRGDTEVLIEAVLEVAPEAKRIADLGTGSGALLVTALLELEGSSGVAVDASQAALEVAEANARRHGLGEDRAQFFVRDWTQADWAKGLGTFDLILCNPPYVEESAELDRDVRDYEPASALFAGPEGLDDYRTLIPQLRKLLNSGGVAIFEIGHTQAEAVGEIAQSHGFGVELRHDLANRPRALVLR